MKKMKDERVVAEMNRIYKVGYLMMSAGILIDVMMQLTTLHLDEAGAGIVFRPIELGVLLLTQIVCLGMMVRKGFMDDGRFAEAERFPKRHYALCALGTGALAALVCAGLRVLTLSSWTHGAQAFWLVIGILALSVTVLTGALTYAAQYVCFVLARKRREKLAAKMDTDEYS